MTMDPVLGIDLGTTNSVVAYTDPEGTTTSIAGNDGARIVPSVIWFPQGGDPVVGEQAKQYAVIEPERVARLFKRGMGEKTFLPSSEPFVVDGKTWSPEELSALVLRKLKQMAEEYLGQEARRAVITVPAYFGEPERAATKDAGELAGFQVERILNEPTAAAFAHGVDQEQALGKVVVFDLGGGTFDVTVIQIGAGRTMEVISTGGDRRLGGADFDRLILDGMIAAASAEGADLHADVWAMADAASRAEEIKKELSTLPQSMRKITAGGRPITFSLKREELEAMLAERLQQVEDTVIYTIEKAQLAPRDVDAVLMVGGSSRIPAFQRLLANACGLEPKFSRNLDEDVARGAAILAAKQGGELDARSQLARLPDPVDAASHGLGVTVTVDEAGTEQNEIMIPASTPIPAEASQVFGAVHEQQTAVEVRLNEGDFTDLDDVRQLGASVGNFARPVSKGHPIRIDMRYTADQLIRLEAYDGDNGQFLCDLEVQHEGLLSADDKAKARQHLARLEVH
jgi:molecular chaperone DnaK